jgi:hypothetical protein
MTGDIDKGVLDWLMEGDPAVRWQVMRDILDRPEAEWQAEREKVATEGWGARFLSEQSADGRWGGGIYTPKWTSTHYTLQTLRLLGLSAENQGARKGTMVRLDRGFAADGGIGEGRGLRQSETCITGMTLAFAAYFTPEDSRLDSLVEHLLRVQTPDGGWNCRWRRPSVHGSFHTTISVLEGLHEYSLAHPARAQAANAARSLCHEFLFAHRLFKSHRTGDLVSAKFTRLVFPHYWHYDILRGLDYLQASGTTRDLRAADAIEVLLTARRPDGRWPLQGRWPAKTWLNMESGRAPSRWNTLRAMRVLKWWGKNTS